MAKIIPFPTKKPDPPDCIQIAAKLAITHASLIGLMFSFWRL